MLNSYVDISPEACGDFASAKIQAMITDWAAKQDVTKMPVLDVAFDFSFDEISPSVTSDCIRKAIELMKAVGWRVKEFQIFEDKRKFRIVVEMAGL